MAESVERYFLLMHMGRNSRPTRDRLWRPAADVYRTSDGWFVKLDLAGVSPEDLEIEVKGSHLVIRGCRRDADYEEGISYHQLEITYSRFERTIHFPCPIEGAHLARAYRDGLLILHLKGEEQCEERDEKN